VLEAALSRLFDMPVKVTSAGRTDAGVHAVGQVISFVSHDAFPIQKLGIALNSALPADLSARDATLVDDAFSARNSALERSYSYFVLNRRAPSAVLRRYAHFDHRDLDLDAMRRAASDLVGEHDFVSFCSLLPERGGTIRRLIEIEIVRDGALVCLRYRGTGFLHRMVRIMTGTLLEIGAGRRAPDSIPAMLAARDRRFSGLTAPAQGLFFTGVRYPHFDSAPTASDAMPLAWYANSFARRAD
jgi:tRNA pseudouridine38-40 synthase